MIMFGGHTGYDYKVMMKRPEWNHHYTFSVGVPPRFDFTNLPIYAERTIESEPKVHQILARGSLDVQALVRTIFPHALPEIRQVDLLAEEFRGGEVIPFSEGFLQLFGRREVNLNRNMLSMFQPTPISTFRSAGFGIGVSLEESTNRGVIVSAGETAYSLKFPAIENMEDKLEKAMQFRLEDNADQIIQADVPEDWNLDEDEESDSEDSDLGFLNSSRN
jgi:hypothetical protein